LALTKFHEKNIALFGKIETTYGVYVAPAATDALPATSMDGSATVQTGNYQYLGDNLSRNEITYLTDTFAEVNVETPQQVLGVLNPAMTVAQAPLSQWLQACGAFITVNGSTGVTTYDNTTVSNASLSIDYRKTSSEDLVNQKLRKFNGIRGTVDVTASIGKGVPLLKFAFKGNTDQPIESPILNPNFGSQITNVAPTIRQATIVTAQIADFGEPFTAQATLPGTVTTITRVGNVATVTMSTAHGLATGRFVNISGATDNLYNGDFLIAVSSTTVFTYTLEATPVANATGTLVAKAGGYAQNFCFAELSAPNFFGFDYQRYLTGCEEGFAKGAIATDINVTMLEDKAVNYQVSGITFVAAVATATAVGHNFVVGNSVTITGATGTDATLYNGTFVVTAITGTTFNYTMEATPTGVATGVLIATNNSVTIFDPDSNITNFFTIQIKFGTGNGKYVTYKWSKVQLSAVKDGKVATYFGKDVTFRNTGNSFIILE
jgi:hypothetical protein